MGKIYRVNSTSGVLTRSTSLRRTAQKGDELALIEWHPIPTSQDRNAEYRIAEEQSGV
jgi:hypothetical protein